MDKVKTVQVPLKPDVEKDLDVWRRLWAEIKRIISENFSGTVSCYKINGHQVLFCHIPIGMIDQFNWWVADVKQQSVNELNKFFA